MKNRTIKISYVKTFARRKEVLEDMSFSFWGPRDRKDLVKWSIDRLDRHRKYFKDAKVDLKINGKVCKTYNKPKLSIKPKTRRLPKKIKLYEL